MPNGTDVCGFDEYWKIFTFFTQVVKRLMRRVVLSVPQSLFDENIVDTHNNRWNKCIYGEDYRDKYGKDMHMPGDSNISGDGNVRDVDPLDIYGHRYGV